MNHNLQRRHYQQIILSRSKNPRHFGQTNPIDLYYQTENPYCGDKIAITVALENNKIKQLKFVGSGCALCLASADLMIDAVTGKSLLETKETIEHFYRVMLGKAELNPDLAGLKAIEGAKRYPVKIKCTTLAWHTLEQAIEHSCLKK